EMPKSVQAGILGFTVPRRDAGGDLDRPPATRDEVGVPLDAALSVGKNQVELLLLVRALRARELPLAKLVDHLGADWHDSVTRAGLWPAHDLVSIGTLPDGDLTLHKVDVGPRKPAQL